MGNHALLSASSSHRWLNCPPSARLGENYEDRGSDFAAEGTDAHSLCEHKLKTALGIPSEDPTENLSWYNEEMEECASGYAAYVLELLTEAKKVTTDPIVLIEQRLDYTTAERYGIQAPSTPHGTGIAMPSSRSVNTAKHRPSKKKALKRPSLKCLTG